MCNLYDIGPGSDHQAKWMEREIRGVLKKIDKVYGIRKTDPGVVLRKADDSSEIEPQIMRWGFHTPFNPAINNARTDKLSGRMWNGAWTDKRRCVIPFSTFYEWSGPTGHKLTHAFQPPGTDFWMAGLWENNGHEDIGLCFTTITTDASEQVSRIHSRMPAILEQGDVDEFLNAEDPKQLLVPFNAELEIFDCENPLKMRAEDHQGPIPISMLPGF